MMKKANDYSRKELLKNETFAKKLGLHQRSITPTTFEGTSGIEFDTLGENSSYREHYRYASTTVTRFCINLEADNIKQQLLEYNETQLKIIKNHKSESVKDLKLKKLSIEETKQPEDEQASDSGTNITQKTDKNKEFANLIELTTFEKEVMQKALDHLSNGYKTALVDVFPRTLAGKNQGQIDTKSLDTHTAILYRNGEKILLIDPNNPQFSSHLSNFDTNIEALYTPNKSYKIYSRPSKADTGYGFDKWRDCIDVAVKLAFLLNNEQTEYDDIYKLMESGVVRLITNNDLIDTYYPEFNKPLRAKQSSNLDKITKTNTKLKEIAEAKLAKQQEKFNSLDIASIEQQISELEKQLKLKQLEYAQNVKLIHEDSLLELTGLDSDYFEHHGE